MKNKKIEKILKNDKLRIETKKLSELIPAEYNPRFITEKSLAGLKKSIEKFGYVEPIIWNERTKKIVGGHQRLKALTDLNYECADVVVINVDENEEKALNVTLNNRNIQGEWDIDKLPSLFEDIKLHFSKDEFKQLRFDDLEKDVKPRKEKDDLKEDEYKPKKISIILEDFTKEIEEKLIEFLDQNDISYKIVKK